MRIQTITSNKDHNLLITNMQRDINLKTIAAGPEMIKIARLPCKLL